MPGMYAVTSIWLVRRTRAILRSAEFGFFGVMVRTCVQTPRFCGAPLGRYVRRLRKAFTVQLSAGALDLLDLVLRPFRTNWLMVGKSYLRAQFSTPAPRAQPGTELTVLRQKNIAPCLAQHQVIIAPV